MRILIVPIGIYFNRVLKAVTFYKPDRVVLCVAKEGPWNRSTQSLAEKLKDKISLFYGKEGSNIQTILLDMRDYMGIFKNLFSFIAGFDKLIKEDHEIIIDTTSTTRAFMMASLTLSIFLENVKCSYTPKKNPPLPSEYPEKIIKDEGKDPELIPTPKVDFSEITSGEVRDILVVLKRDFNGHVAGLTRLLEKIGLETNKANMIKISKLIKKLENFGCVETKQHGRIKEAKLTLVGDSIAEILK
jgi:hypothetical protein